MGDIVVNSRAVAHFKFLRLDKFEARNRPRLHILHVSKHFKNDKTTNANIVNRVLDWLLSFPRDKSIGIKSSICFRFGFISKAGDLQPENIKQRHNSGI